MTVSTIAAMLGGFTAALNVEDALAGHSPHDASIEIRTVIETLRAMIRETIEAALTAPASAFGRFELLKQAVDFAGCDSPLVARCALALAEAVSSADEDDEDEGE